ncbi:hypothetical protein [Mesorhizobium amorphae]|uniref:hypothetical protein n=1 Tax=Mesorhizobium amorphae TaxID=71433 RepID=UPI0011838798|nr:hypothetical protein [Mesorhizobium amorphae]
MISRVTGLWLLLGGFGGGAILGSGVTKRWGADIGELMSSSNFATWMAGLGGAVIGGLISYLIARQTANESVAREDKMRRLTERTQALHCMVITMQLANRLYTMRGLLKEAVAAPEGIDPWQQLQANTGHLNTAPAYNPTDFVPFINAKLADAVHRALLLAERVSSLEAAHSHYSDKRTELEVFLLPFSKLDGGSMQAAVPQEFQVEAFYRTNTLNTLIRSMADFVERDYNDAKALLTEMNNAFQDYFGAEANFKLELENPN